MAIGQGPILTTPLHVANATATIARDGLYLSPVLVAERADQQQRRELDLPDGATGVVRRGMYRVVNDPASQTAYRYATRSGPVICGKTGTAQTGREGRNMAWFTGFAPASSARIAFAFVLEYAGGGGPDCVPLAEQATAACEQLGYFDE
jgi:cell division protein FtsI/penicillin-binding protein 2